MTNPPYAELMKYRHTPEVKTIYDFPVFLHEFPIIMSKLADGYKILDFGCGQGHIYNKQILPSGLDIEYVGIDSDPTLNVDFQLYKSLEEFEKDEYPLRYFDGLLLLDSIEHLSYQESYDTLIKLNPYIDGDIFLMTTNARCLDYIFADPTHDTMYPYEYLYGLFKHLGFDKIEIWRGKGIYPIREQQYKSNLSQKGLKELISLQRKVCEAMGLDWYGNVLLIGARGT